MTSSKEIGLRPPESSLFAPEKINGKFEGANIITAEQFSKKDVDIVFSLADKMKTLVEAKKNNDLLRGTITAAVFFEASTRTFSSFITAAQRLGGGIIPLLGMDDTSKKKGESDEDTIKTLSNYANFIVLRHPEESFMQTACNISPVPIINAGNGTDEHPTQALLNLYSMRNTFDINRATITFFGELSLYRSINSMAKLLHLYPGVKINYASPKEGRLNPDTRKFLIEKRVNFTEVEDINEVIADTDALCITRTKKEYMSPEQAAKFERKYVANRELTGKMKRSGIIMHDLPRNSELSKELDGDHRSVYFNDQLRSGVVIRMALLALLSGRIYPNEVEYQI